ncbi:MAG: alginate export family protein [Candidatus Omnitrophota bacterium]
MAKRILTLCLALVIGIAFAMPATAAVKSIKVGGDLVIRGIYRDNLDFGFGYYDYDSEDNAAAWLMTTTRIWVGAELTDNVSAVIRLMNERDWDSTEGNQHRDDLNLDLAYIKMKDLLMPGLTATIGRQEILLGKGFVVGNVNGVTGNFQSIFGGDFTARKSFDAWRLDYEVGAAPLTITLFDAKIRENVPNNRDYDLWGINAGYNTENAAIEGYVLLLDRQTGSFTNLMTYGARVDHTVLSVPGLNYNLEAAMQSGDFQGSDQDGWAGNADVSYTFQNPMQFQLGAAWFYASGDKGDSDGNWVPLYPDNLGDRIGRITYASMLGTGFTPYLGTNISVPKIYAGLKPTEKVGLSLAWFPMSTIVDTYGDDDLGYGANFGATYQYTEDVTLGICLDYAAAGKAIPTDDEDAWQAIATVALSF